MAEVIWRPEALEQLDAIADYIDQFNPAAANRMRRRLRQLGDSLRTSPRRGRPASGDKRQLVTVRPYILTYEIEGETVYILRIRHSARQPLD